ncbi:VOC family protein [Entomohabitans teleogrylli]|uniref:VOC family protein n=1 Tax=Entomohabitans teleogrylli TaxID=1384589 RepID=UPI00073D52E5|nr:VOC family protein [Entomohabitans teleogrylli]
MTMPNTVILYVRNPLASAAFYRELLAAEPVETSPTFVMFALKNGMMLGLWSRFTAEPLPQAPAGGGELLFTVSNHADVEERYTAWGARGLTMIQKPTRLDFGYSFVAIDPDGHRLRVVSPGEA